jgi:hypothetical protein
MVHLSSCFQACQGNQGGKGNNHLTPAQMGRNGLQHFRDGLGRGGEQNEIGRANCLIRKGNNLHIKLGCHGLPMVGVCVTNDDGGVRYTRPQQPGD